MNTENKAQEMRMKCLAIDDEPMALRLLADDINRIPLLELVATCSTAAEARACLDREPIDLLFLDIQMPVLTGIDFLKSLRESPMVIFTTAYEKYALTGYELSVVDYLLKPIPYDRFAVAVNKAYERFALRRAARLPAHDPFFFVRAEYKEIKVFFRDILYVEGLKDYVKIFLASQPAPILTRLNLKGMEARLPAQQFCRIHNSFVVALDKIDASQRTQVFIRKKMIPVGEKYATDFRKKYRTPA